MVRWYFPWDACNSKMSNVRCCFNSDLTLWVVCLRYHHHTFDISRLFNPIMKAFCQEYKNFPSLTSPKLVYVPWYFKMKWYMYTLIQLGQGKADSFPNTIYINIIFEWYMPYTYESWKLPQKKIDPKYLVITR